MKKDVLTTIRIHKSKYCNFPVMNQVLNLFQDLRFQHLIESNTYETLK